MLHAFNDNGVEVFGYIPATLFSTDAGAGLHYLSDPTYTHRYYVDLSPAVQDAYITLGGNASWRSILVGALRGGGKGIFAIDVTDPSALATSAASKVMWEFTHNDLGYTFSEIQIGKMNNGKWAAVFGNGYNNDPTGDGHAKLFVLYLDGSNITSPIIIDTGEGYLDSVSKECGNASSDCNGLSTPRLVDLNGDGTTDRVYAGDLHGNLWAFNVADVTPSNWSLAYGTNPLFRACSTSSCTSSNRQPITSQPDVMWHPTQTAYATQPNLMVFFGTGQYLTQMDIATSQVQTFYGVWDSNLGNLDRSVLQLQTISTTYNDSALGNVRTISSNTVDYSSTEKGWLIDLPISGERSVTNPVAVGSVVFFNTVIPNTSSSNMCSVGGSGWLMVVDLLTGGAPSFAPIDVNDDGIFDTSDQLGNDPVIGTDSPGVPAESRIISDKRITVDSTGAIVIDNVQPGPPQVPSRMSWSELDAP
jgi:type IV pilus assembly protein PilY1